MRGSPGLAIPRPRCWTGKPVFTAQVLSLQALKAGTNVSGSKREHPRYTAALSGRIVPAHEIGVPRTSGPSERWRHLLLGTGQTSLVFCTASGCHSHQHLQLGGGDGPTGQVVQAMLENTELSTVQSRSLGG